MTLPASLSLLTELATLSSSFIKHADRKLSAHGISFAEFMVMHHLRNALDQTMSRTELADAVSLSASGITKKLNPMQRLHLVEKEINQRDARFSLVKLTPTGLEIYNDALVTCMHCADDLTANISAKQLSTVLEIFAKLK
ncbi:MarR family transcriptional regulator [Zhongshania sp.]|jgi:DNA-binding MarR family transcriptional regulator|uniref:MarR family winged helix-turn-helix transcriptional regulator n=1 Tax=Zhongshania sp. TaxID=1971902 RepID=UPI001B555FC9|nr:MarR family transcriptional regulator [Zhongshania sp.]MBQ0759268.1 MarR family transcriptional regulator [Zhongshania sp.]MBQ0795686.1 MarR family transcriptional regulator [Zhongshania sp.]|tara:strand:+ start:646 stop:1065 length:420 start_codon:yes stop_codon:yes gene_type:complete